MLGPTARAFGTPMPTEYGGKEVLVYGRIQEFYAEAEAEYMSRHPPPMDLYHREKGRFADEAERKDFLQFCVDKACEVQDKQVSEVLNWLGTRAGSVFYGTHTFKWRPKDGESAADAPFVTRDEMEEMFGAEVQLHLQRLTEQADAATRSMEALMAEAENAAIIKMHEMVNEASGMDMVGKETGPSPSETETAAG